MPIVPAGNLTLMRTERHTTKLALVVYVPTTIWSATVDGAQAQGETAITVNNVFNTRTPGTHFQVLIGTTVGGAELGEARWRSYAVPTLTLSAHNCQLPNGAYITVKEELKPNAILVGIDELTDIVYEDGNIPYGNALNEEYLPLARCGSHAFAYRDEITGLATVRFYSRSTAIAAGATLNPVCLWVWRGGTVTVGTTATLGTAGAPNVVTWDTCGDYYCSFTVTDSNGKTHTRYFVVAVRDRRVGMIPYRQIEVDRPEGDVESGRWAMTIKVHTDATIAGFPARGLVILAAEDWYGDTKTSIGNEAWRENIVFTGYIRTDSVKKDWAKGVVEFKAESISGIMDNLTAIAGGLETTAVAPTAWHSLLNLDYNLAVHHILTQHSTVSQLVDCYPNLPSYANEYIDLVEGSLWEQLKDIIGAVRGQAGCNAQGHLYFEVNPQLQEQGDRSTTYVLDTAFADIRGEVDFGQEDQEHKVNQVDFLGIDGAADPVFSLAPETPWESGRAEKVDNIRVADQTEANIFAGLYEGYRNNVFTDVVVDWRGNYRCWDIFPREPFRVNLTAAQNRRGIVWTNERFWIKRVSFEYRAGILLVSTVIEKDSSGKAGSGIPGEADIDTGLPLPPGIPDFNYPPVIPPIPTLPPWTVPPVTPPISASLRPTYDWSHGSYETISAGSTVVVLFGAIYSRFKHNTFAAYCADNDVILRIYYGNLNPEIVATKSAAGVWTVARYNGTTGALISTYTAGGASDWITRAWTSTNVVTHPGTTKVLQATVEAGANDIDTGIAFFLHGESY